MVHSKIFKASFTLECKVKLQGEPRKVLELDLNSLDYDSAIDEGANIAAVLLKENKAFDSVGFCISTKDSTQQPTESKFRSGRAPRNIPKFPREE